MKKKSKFPWFFVLFLFVASHIASYWYFNIYSEGLYKEQAETLQSEINAHKAQIYTAITDISAGTQITMEHVQAAEGYITNRTALFTASDLGRTAIADIPLGTTLSSCMVYDQNVAAGNTAQYEEIFFPNTADIGSYVDIRIRFKNGSDYIVIPKTRLSGISENGISLLTLTEAEHQFLSSALVDASLYEAKVYATIYSSPETQVANRVTYVPRLDNLILIYSEEADLVKYRVLRKELEKQLGITDLVNPSNN